MRREDTQITCVILLGLASACGVDDGVAPTAAAPESPAAQRARPSTASAENRGALVIDDQGGCALFDGDGTLIEAQSDHAVVTSAGVATLECRITGVANSSGRAVRYDITTPVTEGIECQVPTFTPGEHQFTPIWHETVSASGVATLVCQVRRAAHD